MAQIRVGSLPDAAVDAAAQFYGEVLPAVTAELARARTATPLSVRGGAGGGVCPPTRRSPDIPHPNPSPEEERLEGFVLVFAPADHTHRAWRLSAIQSLAREFAPIRVNALASGSEAATAAALVYLETAAGVTGQLLELDDTGAGAVLSSPA